MFRRGLLATAIFVIASCASDHAVRSAFSSSPLEDGQKVVARGYYDRPYTGPIVWQHREGGMSLGILAPAAMLDDLEDDDAVIVTGVLRELSCENYIRCGWYIEATEISRW